MPTQIATLGREKTLATLARRIYRIGDDDSTMQRRAEAALLAANPRLAAKGGFRSGAAIRVPKVPGLKIAETVSRPAARATGITEETALRLQALASRIEDSLGRDSKDRAEALAQITDRAFLEQARKVLPESLELLKRSTLALNQAENEAGAQAERFAKAVQQALEGLKALEDLDRKPEPR